MKKKILSVLLAALIVLGSAAGAGAEELSDGYEIAPDSFAATVMQSEELRGDIQESAGEGVYIPGEQPALTESAANLLVPDAVSAEAAASGDETYGSAGQTEGEISAEGSVDLYGEAAAADGVPEELLNSISEKSREAHALILELSARAQRLESVPEVSAAGYVEMHRLFNPYTGEHFYTSNTGERDGLVKKGWKYEGVSWNSPSSSSTAIYRLYNPAKGFEEHHYTGDQNEIRTLVQRGWNLEGIAWHSSEKASVTVYRLFDKKARNSASSHHYTKDANERRVLLSQGWRDEGVAWYGLASGETTANTSTKGVNEQRLFDLIELSEDADLCVQNANVILENTQWPVNASSSMDEAVSACRNMAKELEACTAVLQSMYSKTNGYSDFAAFRTKLTAAIIATPSLKGTDLNAVNAFLADQENYVALFCDAVESLGQIYNSYFGYVE